MCALMLWRSVASRLVRLCLPAEADSMLLPNSGAAQGNVHCEQSVQCAHCRGSLRVVVVVAKRERERGAAAQVHRQRRLGGVSSPKEGRPKGVTLASE